MRALFITVLLFLSLGMSAQDARDIVKFSREKINLGVVKSGEKANGTFTFENITDDVVEIDIVSTCDCTDATWTTGQIKPGATGTIDFIFDSSKKDKVEPITLDVIFLNVHPASDNPYFISLEYTFEFM